MLLILKFILILTIFLLQNSYAQEEFDLNNITKNLEVAKDLALKFEPKKSMDITSEIRKSIIHRCNDKKILKIYAETFAVDSISLYLSGNREEALKLFKKSISLFPEIKKYISNDEKISPKIKNDLITIELEENTFLVEIFSEDDIFVNGEKICQTSCQINIKSGTKIICTGNICIEKEINQNEKIFLPQMETNKKSFRKTLLTLGIPVAIATTVIAVILITSKEKKTQGIRIIVFE